MLKTNLPDLEIEIIKVKSQGDVILDQPLYEIHKQEKSSRAQRGDPTADLKGLFTKELEDALLNESIDIAVHSMKDLPTLLPEGLEIACTTEREDVRDVLCLSKRARENGMTGIESAVTVATSSPRRIAQLKHHYPHLQFEDMRGNLQTRFRKLEESETLDGIILAAAGLKRLGMEDQITEYLGPTTMLPAIGQGALAVEIKSESKKVEQIKKLLGTINSIENQLVINGERAFLRALDGGCTAPIGVYSTWDASTVNYHGVYFYAEGSPPVIASAAKQSRDRHVADAPRDDGVTASAAKQSRDDGVTASAAKQSPELNTLSAEARISGKLTDSEKLGKELAKSILEQMQD